MKIKKQILVVAAGMLSMSLLVSGCAMPDWLSNIIMPKEESSATDADEANDVDTEVELHIRLYDANGERYPDVTFSISADGALINEDVTNENGVVTLSDIPTNTELEYMLTDAAGNEIASSLVYLHMNSEYENMVINSPTEIVAEEATDETNADPAMRTEIDLSTSTEIISTAMFITSDGELMTANLSSYKPSDDVEEQTVDETIEGEAQTTDETEATDDTLTTDETQTTDGTQTTDETQTIEGTQETDNTQTTDETQTTDDGTTEAQ